MRLAACQAGEQRVEVGAREGPVEGPGDLAVVGLKSHDPCGECIEVLEVVGGQCLALED